MLFHDDLETLIIDFRNQESTKSGRLVQTRITIQNERLRVKFGKQGAHRCIFYDLAAVDNGDVPAKLLSLLQVVGGQYDRRTSLIEAAQKFLHREPNLDVDAC